MHKNVLAVRGGDPVRTAPIPPWPLFEDDEIKAVGDVLASGKVNYWTGDICRSFEDEYAAAVGMPHAIALANGTVALELALYALGVDAGDEVIVPAKTFIATASAAVARGAVPVVADVDPISQNVTVDTLRAVLTPKSRAIVIVHLGGWPAEMTAIMEFAREHNLFVIEDCAQAHGASIDGKPVGSFGDCAAFSFCQDKIITTGGEGGLLAIADTDVWKRAWAYKDHGKGYDRVHHTEHPRGFRWVHESFGSNMRMTEMQAAIGQLQLRKLPDWHMRRARNARILHDGLAQVPGLTGAFPEERITHGWYRYYAFLNLSQLQTGWDQISIIEAVAAEGIPCFVGSCSEIYREEAFIKAGLGPVDALPNAAQLSQTGLAFLIHPTLQPSDMNDMVAAIRKVMHFAVSEPWGNK